MAKRMVVPLLLLAACGDNGQSGGNDLSVSPTNDLSQPGGDLAKLPHDLSRSTQDLAMPQPDLAGIDFAGADFATPPPDLSLLPLCATCVNNTDCASGMCVPYMMGATMKCSNVCNVGSDCPGINACNGMMHCKCT